MKTNPPLLAWLRIYLVGSILLGTSPLLYAQKQTAVPSQAPRQATQTGEPLKLEYQKSRRKTHWIGYGGLLLTDEYLSPLNYGGWALTYVHEQVRPRSNSWFWHPLWSISLGSTLNPAQNSNIYQVQLRTDWAYQKRWGLGSAGYLALGPNLSLGAGALYSTRNGNNPSTGKVDLSLGLALDYSYRLANERFPLALRLGLRTDLLSYRFSQGFGESYYELYYVERAIGKRLYPTHPANAQTLRGLLAIDIPIVDWANLSVGYQIDASHWKLNQLENKQIRQTALLGLTTYLYQLDKRQDLRRFADQLTF